MRSFGLSTRLYQARKLAREHLVEIAAHGFTCVELFATRTHLDYHSVSAIADFQEWLAAAGLDLHGIHAPIAEGVIAGRPGTPFSLASPDPDLRARSLEEAERALHVARRIPAKVLVVHLGLARSAVSGPAENSRDAARRSIDALQRMASPLGVRVAIEVIPNELSRPPSLVHFVENDLENDLKNDVESTEIGICLDFGHAHMDGDLVDAIETVSGHLVATHVHDNQGRTDDHLVPFEGTIDWPAALTAIQKIGYDDTLMLEVAARGSSKETLARAERARKKMERLLAD